MLSKRWRKLYLQVPDVFFDCIYTLGSRTFHFPYVRKGQFIDGVDTYIRHRFGSKIRLFHLSCCFARAFPDKVKHWVSSLGRLGVEQLELCFGCNSGCKKEIIFSFELVSGFPSLEVLGLNCCTLQLDFGSQCNSIKTLMLSNITFAPGALECILSNCLSLEFLYVAYSMLPSKLCIRGPNLRLKFLSVDGLGLKEIDLYAGNLTTLECFDSNLKFLFHYIPLLQNLYLMLYGNNVMPYVYGNLTTDLPHLKCLVFHINAKFYQERFGLVRANCFSNLRQLYLSFSQTFTCDLLSVAEFLHNCPLLQEFHLVMDGAAFDGPNMSIVKVHAQLKRVEISGFSGTQNEVDLVLYILKCASALERMYINRYYKHYCGNGKWVEAYRAPLSEETCQMIEKQLQGQEALSKSAKVIINLHPRSGMLM